MNRLSSIAERVAASRWVKFDDLPRETQADIAGEIEDRFNVYRPTDDLRGLVDPPMFLVRDMPIRSISGYSRKPSQLAVDTYVKMLEYSEAPPILVDGNKFIDGGHRFAAYVQAGRKTIPTVDVGRLFRLWPEWEAGRAFELGRSASVKPNIQHQGKVIAIWDGMGYEVNFPDGRVEGANTKQEVERKAKKWFREHTGEFEIGVGTIEWQKRARRIRATRPIRIDRRVAQESVSRLIADLKGSYFGRNTDEPIGDRGYAFIDHVTIQDVDGNDIRIQVQYRFKSSGSGDLVLGGGSGKITRTGEPAVIVEINGNYSADVFYTTTSGERFVDEAVSVLMHELTHQADIHTKSVMTKTQRVRTEEEIDLVKYYNSPGEIHSYMREVFEEIYRHLPVFLKHFPSNEAVTRLTKLSPTWQRIQGYLTDRNRGIILKGVYQAVQDYVAEQGLQKAASEVAKVAGSLADKIKQGGKAQRDGWYFAVESHGRDSVYVGPFPTEEIGVLAAAWHRNSNMETAQPVYYYDTDSIQRIVGDSDSKFVTPDMYRKWMIYSLESPPRKGTWKQFTENIENSLRGTRTEHLWT